MLRFVTRILLLLLIVAVPLQGASAAAMMTKEVLGGRGLNQVMLQSHDADESLVMTSADGDDDCLTHSTAEQAAPAGKSVKHAGHVCPGCAACSLCSVVPFSFPLSIHLDDSAVQATFSLIARFVSHIPDALQRPPVFRI